MLSTPQLSEAANPMDTQSASGMKVVSVTKASPVESASIDGSQAEKVRGGGHVMAGGMVSRTMISCAQVLVLPHWSVAMYVRVMVSGQEAPVRTSETNSMETAPQLSDATIAEVSGAGTSAAHWTVISAGHVMSGSIVSSRLITWVHTEVLPQESVAVNTRVTTTGQLPLWLSA